MYHICRFDVERYKYVYIYIFIYLYAHIIYIYILHIQCMFIAGYIVVSIPTL
jgi:hypothetical protein